MGSKYENSYNEMVLEDEYGIEVSVGEQFTKAMNEKFQVNLGKMSSPL